MHRYRNSDVLHELEREMASTINRFQRFLGYYEKFTEEAKKVKEMPVEELQAQEEEGGPPPGQQALENGRLYSLDGEDWTVGNPDTDASIEREIANEHCEEGLRELRPCPPEKVR